VNPEVQIDIRELGFSLLITQAGANALCALVLFGLYRTYRRSFLLHWGLAWLALAAYFVGSALQARAFSTQVLAALTLTAGYAHVAGLISGTWMLGTGRRIERGGRVLLFVLPLLLGSGLVFGTLEAGPEQRVLARDALRALIAGLAFLVAAFGVVRLVRREPSASRAFVAALLSVAGVREFGHFAGLASNPVGSFVDSLAGIVVPHHLALFLQLLLLSGLLLWFFEDERRNLARTALALKESEEQRRRSEHMEAVGRLAGGVAHDFNNLLTAITGHAELLLLRTGPGHPDREDLLPIARAAARAAELVRELLTFSRRQPLRPQNFVLDELLSDVRKMLARLLGENVRLELELEAPRAVVHADPAQLELALINLVSNARDAISGSGLLRVRTALASIEDGKDGPVAGLTLAPGRYLRLEVCDDGCGIPSESQTKIFEPFYTTKPGKGTGLGLASVYGIVTLSAGEIRVESAPGKGTTFRIWLPVVEAEPERRVELIPATPGQGGNETLLLVEDEPQVRLLAQRQLSMAGYRVVVAASGEEARERLRANPAGFQLLLSDVVMPGLPLSQLLETVRLDHPGLRVLLMSGYSEAAIGLQGVDLAAANFLQKPFNARALLGAVRAALDAPAAEASAGPVPPRSGAGARRPDPSSA
jgi:signal transduction histidine kinase/CheY-like chemotaxis protein